MWLSRIVAGNLVRATPGVAWRWRLGGSLLLMQFACEPLPHPHATHPRPLFPIRVDTNSRPSSLPSPRRTLSHQAYDTATGFVLIPPTARPLLDLRPHPHITRQPAYRPRFFTTSLSLLIRPSWQEGDRQGWVRHFRSRSLTRYACISHSTAADDVVLLSSRKTA